MTDNEIIKALEIFVNSVGKDFVFANVNIKKDGINDFKHIDLSYDEIFALINRQQADIERLQGWQDLLKAEKHSLIKAEAYKDCIEKVKKELSLIRLGCRELLDNDGVFAIDMARKRVDNLLKEMEREQ